MINEELVEKSVEVGFRIANLSLDLILKGLDALIKKLEGKPDEKARDPAHDPAQPKEPELKEGKQTLKELHDHNEGLEFIELTDPNLRELNKACKDKDIDFSVVKDGKGKYTLCFKGAEANEMANAFKRYTERMVERAEIQAGKKAAKDEKTFQRDFRKLEKSEARAEKKSIRAELKQAKIEAKALEAGRDKAKNISRGARGL